MKLKQKSECNKDFLEQILSLLLFFCTINFCFAGDVCSCFQLFCCTYVYWWVLMSGWQFYTKWYSPHDHGSVNLIIKFKRILWKNYLSSKIISSVFNLKFITLSWIFFFLKQILMSHFLPHIAPEKQNLFVAI